MMLLCTIVHQAQLIALEEIVALLLGEQETIDDATFIRNAISCAQREKIQNKISACNDRLFRIATTNNPEIKALITQMRSEFYHLYSWLSPAWGCLPDPSAGLTVSFVAVISKIMFTNIEKLNLQTYDFQQPGQPDNSDIITWITQVIYLDFHQKYIASIPHPSTPPCCIIL